MTALPSLTAITFNELDANLQNDLDAPVEEFTFWTAPYPTATVANQEYHIAHHAESGRGGIVFVGSGSSGVTLWTDADTPENVWVRHENDDMAP